jgi:hypothetical protein
LLSRRFRLASIAADVQKRLHVAVTRRAEHAQSPARRRLPPILSELRVVVARLRSALISLYRGKRLRLRHNSGRAAKADDFIAKFRIIQNHPDVA